MDSQKRTAEYYMEKSAGSKFWEKTKKQPMVPLGILGMMGMVGYGAYSFKNKGTMSTSVFLMHLRVKAQSVVVGAITIGVAASLIMDQLNKDKK